MGMGLETKKRRKKKISAAQRRAMQRKPSRLLINLKRDIERERQREIKKHNSEVDMVEEEAYPERVRKKLLAMVAKHPNVISMYDVALLHQQAMMDETPYLGEA